METAYYHGEPVTIVRSLGGGNVLIRHEATGREFGVPTLALRRVVAPVVTKEEVAAAEAGSEGQEEDG